MKLAKHPGKDKVTWVRNGGKYWRVCKDTVPSYHWFSMPPFMKEVGELKDLLSDPLAKMRNRCCQMMQVSCAMIHHWVKHPLLHWAKIIPSFVPPDNGAEQDECVLMGFESTCPAFPIYPDASSDMPGACLGKWGKSYPDLRACLGKWERVRLKNCCKSISLQISLSSTIKRTLRT